MGNLYNTTLKTYEYFSVPNLNDYYEVFVYGKIGEIVAQMHITRTFPYDARTLFLSSNYNGTIQVYVDFRNNRIGVQTVALNGWTYEQVCIQHIVGISKYTAS